ncbi:MAG: hypothetical protein VKK97_03365 [Synechococcaceae cyanobacterium]|jgi:hypothetical protein|nr:hypothetical protein [Synechococcaceae cyanobacterium]
MHTLRDLRTPLIAAATTLAALTASGASQAAPYVAFPSQETLRELKLTALACARENTAESCTKAKQLGDPLLDHPRLPTTCKDLIWQLLSKATPAATNSYNRRQEIADPAERLLLVCRSSEKPEATATPATPPGRGGINLGGPPR